jgi:lipopolysaccharide/colanic/teichoic acid biosynthesis glycosyltransferase
VRATSKGPGIYQQTRVGKGGRIFTMYKVRSMRCDAEGKTGPTWAGVVRDPRVTPLGYWLRLLHLDELPQLFNVLRGEMSLVGPRPERPEFVSILAEQVPGYLDRLSVAPGITGLAQINLPPDTDLDSVRRKLVLDCEYIKTAGILLDVRILLCTALRMFGLRGGASVRLLGLERKVELPDAAPEMSAGQTGGPTTLHEVLASSTEVPATIHFDAQHRANGIAHHGANGHSHHNGENGVPQAIRDTVSFATDTLVEADRDRSHDVASNGRHRVKAK